MSSVGPDDLLRALGELGLRPDALVMVHSSLSSFGHFEGGAEAVVDTLTVAVAEGTVVMPTYTRRSLARDEQRDLAEYDPAAEPSIDGVITECFRLRPDVRRQACNPWHPVAAWGRLRDSVIDAPRYGTYGFFLEHGGETLLLGVGNEVHSFVHGMIDDAAEAGLPGAGKRVKSMFFGRLEPCFEREQAQRRGRCGGAELRLVDVARAREAVMTALRERPGLFDAPPTRAELAMRINTVEEGGGG